MHFCELVYDFNYLQQIKTISDGSGVKCIRSKFEVIFLSMYILFCSYSCAGV